MNNDKEFFEKAERMFKYRKIALTCLYSHFIFLLMGIVSIFFAVIGVLLFIAFLAISYKYWKCPSCGTSFPIRHSSNESKINNCPYCGVNLNRNREWRYHK